MGCTSEKATNAAESAADNLARVLQILECEPSDIYASGRAAICKCREILRRLPAFDTEEETH
jgi:hypothetical protein